MGKRVDSLYWGMKYRLWSRDELEADLRNLNIDRTDEITVDRGRL